MPELKRRAAKFTIINDLQTFDYLLMSFSCTSVLQVHENVNKESIK